MKKIVLLSLMLGMVSTGAFAQDDIYFIPTKKDKKEVRQNRPAQTVERYYGSRRDVDEYNRHGKFRSQYDVIGSDSTSNIIGYDYYNPSNSASYYDGDSYDDYAYSRRISRFDDFYWRNPFYWDMWYGSPYWYSSVYWYGSPYWYGGWGWYDPWYNPWYYSGWYRPYYGWGWGGWYAPVYRPTVAYNGGWRYAGTNNHGYYNGRLSNNDFARRNNLSRRSYNNNSYFRNNNNRNDLDNNNINRPTYNQPTFGGSRNPSFGGGSTRGFGGGGSFGGSRGGGGHFGGRR